jgi:hypothetical protein
VPPDREPPAPETPNELEADEYARLRRGFHPGVSAGFTTMMGAVAAGGTASFIANFGVARHADLRASLRIAVGPGISNAGGANPFGADGTLEFPLDARFNIGSVYTIVLGFTQGALFLNASDCNITLPTGTTYSCGRTITPYYLFGPELSFLSFRMGSKRELELDIIGGPQFIVPQSGLVFYPRATLSLAYMIL